MKKKSFWKRCNRGFIVSMALLVAVLGYVTVTQVMLAGQKKEIRAITDQVQTVLVDAAKVPNADAQAMVADTTKAAAYRDAAKKKLAGLFVKDAAYLDAGAESVVDAIKDAAAEDRTITSMKKDANPYEYTIRIDEDTAAVSESITYSVTGTWSDYDDDTDSVTLKERTGRLSIVWDASFVKEDGAWNLYRINGVSLFAW